MSLFAIGDLHLAIGEPDKTMEAFGDVGTAMLTRSAAALICCMRTIPASSAAISAGQ